MQDETTEHPARSTGDSTSAAQRLTELESQVTYLQRELHELNQVVLEQQRQLERLSTLLARLDEKFDSLKDDGEVRSPQDERPPHY